MTDYNAPEYRGAQLPPSCLQTPPLPTVTNYHQLGVWFAHRDSIRQAEFLTGMADALHAFDDFDYHEQLCYLAGGMGYQPGKMIRDLHFYLTDETGGRP